MQIRAFERYIPLNMLKPNIKVRFRVVKSDECLFDSFANLLLLSAEFLQNWLLLVMSAFLLPQVLAKIVYVDLLYEKNPFVAHKLTIVQTFSSSALAPRL